MPWALPLTAFFVAAGIEITQWGQGRFNWGPRLGAVLFLVFGQVAFTGTVLGDWMRAGIAWLAGWADTAVTFLLGAAAGNAVGYLIAWLPAALIGAYWLAAILPGNLPGDVFNERMTWRLAWIGMLIPVFLSAVPGPAGDFLSWVFTAAAAVGAGIVNWLFAMGASIPGIGGA